MSSLSLIVPNLNEKSSLPTFFESLVNQSFKDFEVIIVDGFSVDGSIEVMERYLDKLRLMMVFDEERRIGLIRNKGSSLASGEILVHSSSDTYFNPDFMRDIVKSFEVDEHLISLTGLTYPLNASATCHLAYHGFDFLRYCLTRFFKKYRPSGNFLAIKRNVFEVLGGFPPVYINEDGLLGYRIDDYARLNGYECKFNLSMWVGHHAKRFKNRNGLKTVLFYFYVFGNLAPCLRRFFKHLEAESGEKFVSRSDLY